MKRRDFLKATGVPLTYGILGPGFAAQVMGSKYFGDEVFQSEVQAITAGISRTRLPETLGWNFPEVIANATGGTFLGRALPSNYTNQPVAIIGAGAAGLSAGYELLKLGLDPVYFEMQETDVGGNTFTRPGGRGFTHDFTAGGFTPAGPTDQVEPLKAIGDLGAMRYPTSHTALYEYVDQFIGAGQYQYADANLGSTAGNEPSYENPLSGVWNLFRNPAIFTLTGSAPNESDVCVWPTDYHCRGVAGGNLYRIQRGMTLAQVDPAIQRLLLANHELLFGAGGILTPLVGYYSDGDAGKIEAEWNNLNDEYQAQTLYEVLIRNWPPDDPAYQVNGVSLVDLFGNIGIGSGGFDVFWGTTFMETLRIRIHEDEESQRTFVGGTSYMLRPFLTHQGDNASASLLDHTQARVRTNPVVRIQNNSAAGIDVITRDPSTGTEDPAEPFLGVILTAAPSAIRARVSIDESLFERGADDPAIVGLRNMTLTNSGKAFLSFPGVGAGEGPGAFWMNRSQDQDYWDNSQDQIATLLCDENVRSAYTFDDYNFGSQDNTTNQATAGALMLTYTWGQNADAFTGLQDDQQGYIRAAWQQLDEIYGFGGQYDSNIEEALATGRYQTISWTSVDGMNGGYRMSGPGMNARFGADGDLNSQQHAMWRNCYATESGFCLAGEAVAWLGLSGWIEGSIQTGLASTNALLSWIEATSPATVPLDSRSGLSSFVVPAHPGPNVYVPDSIPGGEVLFLDDFSGDLSQWQPNDVSTIIDGSLQVSGFDGRPSTKIISIDGSDWSDYELTFTASAYSRFRTLFRVADDENFYRLHVHEDGTMRLEKRADGKTTLLQSVPSPPDFGSFRLAKFAVTIRAQGNALSAEVLADGKPGLSVAAEDDTYTSGGIGWVSQGRATGLLRIDDVKVTAI